MVILSGPSAVGKSTICDYITTKFEDIVRIVTITTRPKRNGEIEGKEYIFLTEEELQQMESEGRIIEKVEYAGFYYATDKAVIENVIKSKKVGIFVMSTQGKKIIEEIYGRQFSIFIDSSDDILIRRIKNRGDGNIEFRMKILEEERKQKDNYDVYIKSNDTDLLTELVTRCVLHFKDKFFIH